MQRPSPPTLSRGKRERPGRFDRTLTSQERSVGALQQQFIDRATELGAKVHVASSPEEALAAVVEIFRAVGAREVVLSPDLGDDLEMLAAALAAEGAKFVEDPSPEAVAGADIGVTGAALAVAETGSIVVAGNDLLPRLATTLPLIHVALVGARTLVPSLDEAGEFLRRITLERGAEAVRYASFVSGPSRSSDVEKTATIGVHGPRELHIILV